MLDKEGQVLVLRDNARAELEQIKSLEDGLTYLNKVKSIEVWVKAEKKDAELQNMIAEQKLRTQRILGKLIHEGQYNGEIAERGENRYTQGEELKPKTITEIGLSHKQSSAFQQIAKIPEEKFEEFIQEKKEAVNNAVAELTTSGALKLAKSLKEEKQSESDFSTAYDMGLKQKHSQESKELIKKINALPKEYREQIKNAIKL